MMSSLSQSLALISLITTITAQTTTTTPTQGCARYRDYPLNVCFNTSDNSMIIQCQNNTYTKNEYTNNACEGNTPIQSTELNCVEGSDCVCQSNNQCDYAFYMEIDGVEAPTTSSDCNGTIWQNRPIIINQCLVTNDTKGTETVYECPDTNTNTSELTVTSCTDGVPTGVAAQMPVCNLECPQEEESYTCGRYQYGPLNACAVTNINGNIQSKSITCTAPGEYTESVYDNEFCTGTAETETQLICTEGSECVCNNENPCEYATTRNYTNDADNTCVGESYEEVLYVLGECVRVGQLFQVNTNITCVMDSLWTEPCGKDVDASPWVNVCDVQCPDYGNVTMGNVTMGNVSTTEFVSTDISTTDTPVVCDRVSDFPVGVCLHTHFGLMKVSYEYTCNDDGLNYTSTTYMSENCTGTVLMNDTEACDGECYCGSGIPCPYGLYKQYFPTEECARYGYVPLNYCGRVEDELENGTLISEKIVCNSRTGVFSAIQYDDDQCEGSIINETVLDCGEQDCICSNVECDYVSWNVQTASGNKTCSANNTVNMDFAAVLDECMTFHGNTNVKVTCNNNSVDIINCTDNSTTSSDFLKTLCDVQCTNVIETSEPTTTAGSDPFSDVVCFGDTYMELAIVIDECIDGVQVACNGIDGTLDYQSCDENGAVSGGIVAYPCDLQCMGVTTTQIPDTTDIETSETDSFDTTDQCYDRSGRGVDGDFDIGVYIDCREETMEVNITYNNYTGNWFGILFAQAGRKMYGEALIYTTGKSTENITNGDGTPKLYLYMLEGPSGTNTTYNGGVNGRRDWDKISENIDGSRAEIVYRQDLDETEFNLTTNDMNIRWGRGENDGSGYTLGYHTPAGRASTDLTFQLQDITPTPQPTTEKEKDNTAGIIIGAVIGAFFAVMICFGLIWAIMDHRKRKANKQSGSGYGKVSGGGYTDNDVEMQGTR